MRFSPFHWQASSLTILISEYFFRVRVEVRILLAITEAIVITVSQFTEYTFNRPHVLQLMLHDSRFGTVK